MVPFAYSARILIIPMQGKSHMIATNAIGQQLKKNGQEVRLLNFNEGKMSVMISLRKLHSFFVLSHVTSYWFP